MIIRRTMTLAVLIIVVGAAVNCNNFNLLENMENPAGVKGPRVFVSSIKATGHFSQANGSALAVGSCTGNGVGLAVCTCKTLAAAAGLRNADKFAPWLAETGIAPRCVLQGNGSNTCTGNPRGVWFNMKNEPVALSGSDLTSGSLKNPVRYNEYGADMGSAPVYTGTGTDGNAFGAQCLGSWVSGVSGDTATIGYADRADSGWTAAETNAPCSTLAAIYCFETQL